MAAINRNLLDRSELAAPEDGRTPEHFCHWPGFLVGLLPLTKLCRVRPKDQAGRACDPQPLRRLFRFRVGAEDFDEGALLFEFGDGFGDFFLADVAVAIDKEEVFPGFAF